MSPRARWAAAGLAVMLLAGCASRSARTPQVQPPQAGTPVPTEPSSESLSDYIRKMRHLSANARPLDKTDAVETLETRDPVLAAELLQMSVQPTEAGYRNLAERYRERGVLDAAHRYYNKAIALNPRDSAAYEGLARVWRDWGLPELALSDAHRAVYHSPRQASAHNTFGTVMQALGNYAEARRAYERASRLEPQSAYAVNNLCYLAFVQGQIDVAIDTCRRAIALDPAMTAARNNLALAFAASGRIDLARHQFVEAGDRASGLYNTGIMYLATGDDAAALSAFDEASRARPGFQLARDRARLIRERMYLSGRPTVVSRPQPDDRDR